MPWHKQKILVIEQACYFPFGSTHFLRLERPDHAYGYGRAGKQRDRLAQVLEDASAGALLWNEDGVSSLQGCAENVAGPPFPGAMAHHGAVGPDNEYLLLVG